MLQTKSNYYNPQTKKLDFKQFGEQKKSGYSKEKDTDLQKSASKKAKQAAGTTAYTTISRTTWTKDVATFVTESNYEKK